MVGRNRAQLLFLVRARFRRASLGGGTLRGNAADTLRGDLGSGTGNVSAPWIRRSAPLPRILCQYSGVLSEGSRGGLAATPECA
eukprot:scaffold99135_cov75-Phaeocystis_antarctica.AAC.1